MNTIKFTIEAKAYDSYIYAGNMYIILTEGHVLYGSYARIIDKLKEKYPHYSSLIELAFRHNEYISSRAGKVLLSIGEVKTEIRRLWSKASKDIELSLTLNDLVDILHVFTEWTSIPLDVKMYAMRMYLGCRKGLFEVPLNPDGKHINPGAIDKRFDAKVTCVTSKCGSVLVSADSDGLFSGDLPINDFTEKLVIEEDRVLAPKSLRTGWFKYDVLNYSKQSDFVYLQNETSALEKGQFHRSFDGEHQESKRIVAFGQQQIPMPQLLSRNGVNAEDIVLCFNSSTSGFFLLKDGRFLNVNLLSNGDEDIYFSSRPQEIVISQKKRNAYGRPLTGSILPYGCVVEYMNNVVLYQKGNAYVLEEEPAMRVRTFMSSFRYKDIVAITKKEEIAFHSVDTFDIVKSTNLF